MASSLMLWSSYYPAIQANSVQYEHPLPWWDNSEGLWTTTELSPEPGGFLISQEQRVLPAFTMSLVLMLLRMLSFILVHRIHFYHAAGIALL